MPYASSVCELMSEVPKVRIFLSESTHALSIIFGSGIWMSFLSIASLYAMFTLMFFLILIVMAAMNIIQARDERKQKKRIKNA